MIDRTPADIYREHQILRADPQRYIEMMSDRIARDPEDASAYFSRHHAWARLERYDLALADLDRVIGLEKSQIGYLSRGNIWQLLGNYTEALEDYGQAERLEPEAWVDCWGPLYQADCHSRLGHEAQALAACARLPEGFWSPGLRGTPAGTKAEIIAEVRRRLASRRD